MDKENENQETMGDLALPDYLTDHLTDQKRKELEEDLASLTPGERDSLEWALKNYPNFTPLEALWHLRAGGM
jgi:hypothetical protein